MSKRIVLLALGLSCSMALVLGVLRLTSPALSARVQGRHGGWTPIELPWRFEGPAEDQVVRVTLHKGTFTPSEWRVIPDDDLRAIRVNGRPLDLRAVPSAALRDWSKGFAVDLSRELVAGDNEIELVLSNHGGPGGLAFKPETALRSGSWVLAVLAMVPWTAALAYAFRLRRAQLLLLVGALVPIALYWAVTPYSVRDHDATGPGGHLAYVAFVADHHAIPSPAAGWTFYHPPLYYAAAAVPYASAKALSVPPDLGVQAFSILLWDAALAGFAGALRLTLPGRPAALALATAALAFWPSGIIHSVRVGNDAAMYALAGGALFFLARWWARGRRSDLLLLSSFTALCLASKTNALALAGVAGVLVLVRAFRERAPGDLLRFSGLVALGAALGLANNLHRHLRGETGDWLVSNSGGLASALRVPADLAAFLPLELRTFVSTPYVSAWDDRTGRANFWTYLLRTSLTGEFDFGPGVRAGLSIAFGVLLLGLLALALARGLPSRRSLYKHLPWILLAPAWIASLVWLRIKLPFTCSNDFRYVWPVMVPALAWFARGSRLSLLALAAVPVLSLVFFATP